MRSSLVELCLYGVRAGVQDAAVSFGIKGARWTGCWDSLWSALEGAEYQKESGSENQWLVRWKSDSVWLQWECLTWICLLFKVQSG